MKTETKTIAPKTAEALTLLYRHHKEYITMAKVLGGKNMEVKNYAADFVQEAYLRLSRYDDLYDKVITKKGKVSKGYMFFVLRSIILNTLKKKSNLKFDYTGTQFDFEEVYGHIDHGMDPQMLASNALEEKVYTILKQEAKWFDYELFKKYLKTGKSFKALASESGLGLRTIYLSIKRCKLIIAEHLFEDFQDYKNGDFNLI